MNIEFVSKFGVWAYYRKKKSEGPFELFSDSSSKIKYLKSISRLFISVAFLNLLIGFINLYIGLGESTERFLNTGLSFLNFIVVIFMCMQILKVERRKKDYNRKYIYLKRRREKDDITIRACHEEIQRLHSSGQLKFHH